MFENFSSNVGHWFYQDSCYETSWLKLIYNPEWKSDFLMLVESEKSWKRLIMDVFELKHLHDAGKIILIDLIIWSSRVLLYWGSSEYLSSKLYRNLKAKIMKESSFFHESKFLQYHGTSECWAWLQVRVAIAKKDWNLMSLS